MAAHPGGYVVFSFPFREKCLLISFAFVPWHVSYLEAWCLSSNEWEVSWDVVMGRNALSATDSFAFAETCFMALSRENAFPAVTGRSALCVNEAKLADGVDQVLLVVAAFSLPALWFLREAVECSDNKCGLAYFPAAQAGFVS